MTDESEPIRILHFSDVLCVWAFVGQRRLDELIEHFGEAARISYHFVPVFGCTRERIGVGWKDRGGYEGFSEHVCHVATGFEHAQVSQNLWRTVRPASSSSAHHFLKAVDIACPDDGTLVGRAAWRLRQAFFEEARDISSLTTQLEIADELGLPIDDIRAAMEDGRAIGELFQDVELRDQYKVRGSPTYVLNEGRQILYGNVGYRVIEANVEEILRRPESQASWC